MDCLTSKNPPILIEFLGELENIFSKGGKIFKNELYFENKIWSNNKVLC